MNALDLQSFVGRSETVSEPAGHWRAAAMAATLNRPAPALGSALPAVWHWLYCVNAVPQDALAEDGHPKRGPERNLLMPPVPQPLRMWAGSQLQFHQPIAIGDGLQRHSRVVDIRQTDGSNGEMVFVGLQHHYSTAAGLAISERQDIAYLHSPAAGYQARVLPPISLAIQEKRSICPDERLLFRYSALSFNAHRIHYDLDYARRIEGYPGLVVQGPLLATLLMDLWCESPQRPALRTLGIRAMAPAFAGQQLELCAGEALAGKQTLWAQQQTGAPVFRIDLEFA